MLSEITIENVAVIEKVSAEFEPGFNVLTGETGAGKSILIDSINAILGNRTSRDIVRRGSSKAKVWARFTEIPAYTLRQLEEAGYPAEDELLLYREISEDGKSTCRINGMPATASILRDVCAGLVNIHGQHDNQSLLNPSKHIHTLDLFADNDSLLREYQEIYTNLTAIKKEINSLSMDEEEKTKRLDLLKYELEEIDTAELSPGEEDALLERRNLIQHSKTIADAINAAYMALSGGDEGTGAYTLLSEAAQEMDSAAEYSSELQKFSEPLNEIYYTARELASDLGAILDSYDFDPEELNIVEERLDLIFRLKQKYGSTLELVIAYGEKIRREIDNIEFSDERLNILNAEYEKVKKAAQDIAEKLTESRVKAFEKLAENISLALEFLNMPGIVLELKIQTQPLSVFGQDVIEFYISTNPGETPKPLAKIASGGELSRIMLAIKSALADKDDTSTVIYDEIDTGISGMAAGRIGRLLRKSSAGRQVICVTHTAQVASYATRHLIIEKMVEDGRTFTNIRPLEEQGRVEELARIISGDNITDIAMANAQEMIKIADKNMSRVKK